MPTYPKPSTIQRVPNQEQKDEMNKLLSFIIKKVGVNVTIELLEGLKTKVEYEF